MGLRQGSRDWKLVSFSKGIKKVGSFLFQEPVYEGGRGAGG